MEPIMTKGQQQITSQINSNKALFIKVTPEKHAVVSNCFDNIAIKCKQDGGKPLYGWIIWEQPFFVEAELHCIWSSDDGASLKDITPQKDENDKIILFLPDETIAYNGITLPNKYMPKYKEQRLLDYLSAKMNFQVYMLSLKTPYSDEIKLSIEQNKKRIEFLKIIKEAKDNL